MNDEMGFHNSIRSAQLTRRQAYQNSASFVPKLAGKVVSWLDVQPDDVILDLGCGGSSSPTPPFPILRLRNLIETNCFPDGVLNVQFASILSKGKGRVHGVDASEAMISAARKAAASDGAAGKVCTFEGKLHLVSKRRECIIDWR